jgi:predicted acylesterase/phospholipase RssA
VYIGSYKALKEYSSLTNIKSVIGSSAGGIVGLAISCQLEPE